MLHPERQNNINNNIFFIFIFFTCLVSRSLFHTMNVHHTKVSKYQHITKYPPYIFLFFIQKKDSFKLPGRKINNDYLC